MRARKHDHTSQLVDRNRCAGKANLSAGEEAAWKQVSAPVRASYLKGAGDIGAELITAAEELRDALTR